jgi:beta-lactamase class D
MAQIRGLKCSRKSKIDLSVNNRSIEQRLAEVERRFAEQEAESNLMEILRRSNLMNSNYLGRALGYNRDMHQAPQCQKKR